MREVVTRSLGQKKRIILWMLITTRSMQIIILDLSKEFIQFWRILIVNRQDKIDPLPTVAIAIARVK